MLAIFRNLVFILQVWAITSVRAQTGGSLQPPYEIVTVSRTDNVVGFECREIATQLKLDNWMLYRNCVPENTTDPCISDENFSDGLLTISSQCDGLYSCGVEYTSISSTSGTTGLVLTEPVSVYAIPTPIETGMQSVDACVGETVFLPSFMPVSPLGNNEVIWFWVQNSGVVPAKNGIVTANYSYNLVNVSILDTGTYFAKVIAPGSTPVNGPSVMLTVTEKPGIDLIEVVDGLMTVTVTPHNAEFKYKWRLNGIVSPKNGQNFSLPSTIDEDDQIELMISSPCGASVIATIYILTIPSGDVQNINGSFPTASPEVENSPVCFEKSLFIVIIVIVFFTVSLTCTILLSCACYHTCKKTRKQDTGETDPNYQASPQCLNFAKELKQLILTKLSSDDLERDYPYETCLLQLLEFTLFIKSKKKLPKKINLVPSDVDTDGPQGKEPYPGMDDLPPQFHAQVHLYCMKLGISWKEYSDVHKYSSLLTEPADNMGQETVV